MVISLHLTCVKKKAVKTYIETITPKDVLTMAAKIPSKNSFNGTMKVHYYSWSKENSTEVHMSTVSCLQCKPGTPCSHFGIPGSPWIIKNPSRLHGETDNEDPDNRPVNENINTVINISLKSWVAVLLNDIWYPGKFSLPLIEVLKTYENKNISINSDFTCLQGLCITLLNSMFALISW